MLNNLSGASPVTEGSRLQPRPDRAGTVLNPAAIKRSLKEVQENFASIDSGPSGTRERLDRLAVDNMMIGYAFIDELIENKVDLFSLGQLHLLLEVNALVLCGSDEEVRRDAAQHLAATDRHFFDNADGGIRDVVEWHALHANESAWMRAAGVYIRILSEPELFIEGNHRTGALVMSYILARAGHPPFVVTVSHAKQYFAWSALFNNKRKTGLLRWQMPWLTHRFARFLMAQADPTFLRARRDLTNA